MTKDKEATCIGEKCPNYCPNCKENCPNYIETVWINEQNSKPIILEDCAPKRTIFMLMEMHNHLMGFKQYACETRNILQKLNNDTREFMALQDGSRNYLSEAILRLEHRQEKILEDKKNR